MKSDFQNNKKIVREYYKALETSNSDSIVETLKQHTSEDWHWFGVHPFGEQDGATAVAEAFWQPFLNSWESIQRREDIFIAGRNAGDESEWVISMGHFMGILEKPWLGIPATGQITFLRYADFNCIKDGKIVRSGYFCDLISVMHQAGIQPLPQQLGASFIYPGPKTHDGIQYEQQDPAKGDKTLQVLNQMIEDLNQLNISGPDECPPELLAQTWNQDMIWYGPAGIGASYTIPRYQQQHQYPFRKGLTNKVFNGHICRFAEGNYAGFFGWPNLNNTPSGDFMGLPANDTHAEMRVVDMYRREGDKLAENWVIIDLPWWLLQQGLDVFARCSEIARTDYTPSSGEKK